MKYSWQFKLNCVLKYKEGKQLDYPTGLNKDTFKYYVYLWVKQYDELGVEGLKHSLSNKNWTAEKRFELVAKVLAGNSIASVALNALINKGQLYQWVKRYNEKSMDGLQLKKGRPPNTFIMKKKIKKTKKLSISEAEELKLLRERILYLETENEYLKKLDALVSKREAAEAKAKKRK